MGSQQSALSSGNPSNELEHIAGEPALRVSSTFGTRRYKNPWPDTRPTVGDISKFWGQEVSSDLNQCRSQEKSSLKGEGNEPDAVFGTEPLSMSLPFEKGKYMEHIKHPPNNGEAIQVMWVGHSTVLIQMHGINIITDPIWAETCTLPVTSIPMGNVFSTKCREVSRMRQPPFPLSWIPQIDIVLISHDHFDHLDEVTLTWILHRDKGARIMAPSGLKDWFVKNKIFKSKAELNERVCICDWYDTPKHYDYVKERISTEHSERHTLQITCVPAKHWSGGRSTPFSLQDDTNVTLWCGWVLNSTKSYVYGIGQLQTQRLTVYFAGDTGYMSDKEYAYMKNTLGPFDLALLPISGYDVGNNEVITSMILTPEEAVEVHCQLKVKESIPIHWGTFQLTSDPFTNIPARLLRAVRLAKRNGKLSDTQTFRCLIPGQTLVVEPDVKIHNSTNDQHKRINNSEDEGSLGYNDSDCESYDSNDNFSDYFSD